MATTEKFIHRVGDLEIDQNMDFQKRLWNFQWYARRFGILFLMVGLTGFFGKGPLSSQTAKDEGGTLTVSYERFPYIETETSIRVELGENAAREGTLRLWIDNDSLKGLKLMSVLPEPQNTYFGPDKAVFEFSSAAASKGSHLVFNLEGESIGRNALHMGLEGGSEISFWQFFWP